MLNIHYEVLKQKVPLRSLVTKLSTVLVGVMHYKYMSIKPSWKTTTKMQNDNICKVLKQLFNSLILPPHCIEYIFLLFSSEIIKGCWEFKQCGHHHGDKWIAGKTELVKKAMFGFGGPGMHQLTSLSCLPFLQSKRIYPSPRVFERIKGIMDVKAGFKCEIPSVWLECEVPIHFWTLQSPLGNIDLQEQRASCSACCCNKGLKRKALFLTIRMNI